MKASLSTAVQVLGDRKRRRAWMYNQLDRLRRALGMRTLRFQFEMIYLEKDDPWDYRTSLYESAKYRRALKRALEWRRGPSSVLDIGCSIGVFTRMLAAHFGCVTAVDQCREALRIARSELRDAPNVSLVRADIRSLNLRARYDVIFCAEVLYYMPKRDATCVLKTLRRHLARDGIVIIVSNVPSGADTRHFYDNWKLLFLEGGLRLLFDKTFADPQRPYIIQIFDLPEHAGVTA